MRKLQRLCVFISALAAAACSSNGSLHSEPPIPAGCVHSSTVVCGTFTAYKVNESAPHGLVYNPNGPLAGLWFTNRTNNASSAVVQFNLATHSTKAYRTPTASALPGSINYAENTTLWFPESGIDKVGHIDASRNLTEYPVPTHGAKPLDITRGPDGAMWFAECGAGKIGRIAADGSVREFVVGPPDSKPTSLITGPDGNIWFTLFGTDEIGRMTTAGNVKIFLAGTSPLTGIITDSGGDLWYGQTDKIGRMTLSGKVTEYHLPSGFYYTGAIFGRSDGVFAGAIKRNGTGAIVEVSTSGNTTEYDLPQRYLLPIELALAPDGTFYMTVESFHEGVSSQIIFSLR